MRNRGNRWRLVLAGGVALGLGLGIAVGLYARAAMNVPVGLAYSGVLKNNGVVEAGAKTHDLTFELFDGNATVCTDARSNVTVTDGRFDFKDLFAGNGCLVNDLLATKPNLSIRIAVENQPLLPAQPLGTVPFAARARVAETVEALPAGSVVQVAYAQDTALQNVNGSSTIPDDDTIPQSNEGAQVFTTTFTPSNATDQIHVQYELNYGTSAGAGTGRGVLIIALFKDNDPDALAVSFSGAYYANGAPWNGGQLNHMFVAGTTSPITLKVRIGWIEPYGTITINGHDGARKFGGKSAQRMRILEVR